MLLERKKIIESSIQDAETKAEEANTLKAQYETRLVNAQNDAQNIVKNAVVSAEKIEYEAFEAAKKDTEFMRSQAEKEAQEIKLEACSAAKKDLASLICSAAGRLIKKNLDEKANKVLIDDMIENLDKVKLN
jgi:F-type H+-transporting ATPase subunit b